MKEGPSSFEALQGRSAPCVSWLTRILCLVEHFGDVDAALAHRAGERLAENAGRPLFVAGEGSRRRVEGDQDAGLRLDEGEPGASGAPCAA